MATQPKLRLKVFSGPHQGAEILLSDGEYVLGSGDECDVILNDPAIEVSHARLEVRGGKVTCAAIESARLFLEGSPVTESRLESFQYLTLGSTHVAVGPRDGGWPVRPLPTMEPVEEAETPAESDETAAETSEETAETTSPSPQPATSNKTRFMVTGGLLAVLLVGWLVVFLSATIASNGTGENDPIEVADLQQVVAEVAPDADVEIKEKDGIFHAQGYVMERGTAITLENKLVDLVPSVDTTKLWDTDSIVRGVQSILELHDLKLDTKPTAPGEIFISGKLPPENKWEQALVDINEQTKIKHLDYDLDAPSGERLVSKPIAKAPTDEDPQTPVVQAPVMPAKPPERKPEPPPKSLTDEERLQAKVLTAVGGLRSYLVLDTGENVFLGATVGGYEVAAIEYDHVVFVKDGNQLLVKIGDTP